HNFFTLVAQNYDPQKRRVNTAGFGAGGLRQFHPAAEFEQELHTTTGHLAAHFDLRGPNYTCLTACAASSQAVGEALWQIRHGVAARGWMWGGRARARRPTPARPAAACR